MIASLVGILLLADADNFAGTFDASNRSELRLRGTQGDPASPALDFVDVAAARLGFSDRRWDLYLSYTPVFTAPYLFQKNEAPPIFLNTAGVGASWQSRRVRLSLTEDGNYGQTNATLLINTVPGATTGGTSTTPGAQVAGAPLTLSYAYSRTALYMDATLDPRLRLTMTLSYQIQSGLDTPSRIVFPYQKGPRADATLAYSATRIDRAETHLVGQLSDSTEGQCPLLASDPVGTVPPNNCDPSAMFVFATEAWRHRFSGDVQGSLGVGATYVRNRLHDSDTYTTNVWPVVEAWIEKSDGLKEHRRSIRFDADLEPIIDVRTGAADYRATLTGLALVPLPDENALRLQVWGIQSVHAVILSPLTLVRAEAELEHFVTPWFSCGGGARVEWEHQDPFGSFYTLLAFGQATFRVPTARF